MSTCFAFGRRPCLLIALALLLAGGGGMFVGKEAPAAAPATRAISARPTTAPGEIQPPGAIQLCQAFGPPPCAAKPMMGVDTALCGPLGVEQKWNDAQPIPWQYFAQGEYVGMPRLAHVPAYWLRVDDEMEFVYRLTREVISGPYLLEVGDTLELESFTDERLDRVLLVQPDGTVTLRLLGQVRATGRSVQQLRDEIEAGYEEFYKVPAITVTPLQLNTKLEDLRATVDARAGQGGQRIFVRVTPEGTVQLPAIGSVFVQGLTLDEVKREVDARYEATIQGIEVTPVLSQRAPRFIYVVGEVALPGRFELVGPTTVMQAVALAGSWNPGANTRQIVVFRRGPDWRLMATLVDLQGALLGKRPAPADELWLNDSDIVVVPKTPIKVANDFIEQVFARGIYGVVPFQGVSFNFGSASSL